MTKRPSFFSYVIQEESIALITLDLPGESINKLSTAVLNELESLIEKLGSMNNLSGAIFFSTKPNIFIAGADIREIQAAQTNIESGRAFLRYGQTVFNKLSELAFPTCVAIDGACMGGGLEFSLSCDYRVISTNPKAQLALPEVKLGIMPGWGGSQRMPRLIGLSHSIDLICSGRSVGAQEAFQIGLVDDYSWPDTLQDSAINMITSANTDSKWKHRRLKLSSPLQINDGERLSILNLNRERITREYGSHYPAPITALEAIEEGYSLPLKEGLEIELQKIDYLLESPVSQNLIHLFFLSKELEKKAWVDKNTAHSDIANVGILGAGIMGQGIAAANITRNIPVTLSDSSQEILDHGLSKVIDIVSHDKHLSAQRKEDQYTVMSRLNGSLDHSDLKNAQLVIEAVTEDPDIKTKLYEQVEEHISPHCILASNTTSISISKLSEKLKHKNRFIGLHFFNPVQKMKLVEVIRSQWTSE
ncbi:MAG: 3-hydroxyacyl-CoA dehydrogenase NAD-binding domain-containing protein, partial [Spirochaetota bacterium]|nr:3-hydroxyacyl-CoA dehydrogenase NAD-binding domain-containing protein [Spirochaetota bacterium]